MHLPTPTEAVLRVIVVAAAASDLRDRRISNNLNAAAVTTALILHLLAHPPAGAVLLWLSGAATGFAIFLPFYLLRGMAAGDVKLMAAVGAFAGPSTALQIALASMLAGGVLALTIHRMHVWRSWTLASLHGEERAMQKGATVPYGVAICAGSFFVSLGNA